MGYHTYKSSGRDIALAWTAGSLSAEQRIAFIDAIRNGKELDFTIEFNPSYPKNLNKNTDILYSNQYFTKYRYDPPSGPNRVNFWYEIRDPYLSWYDKFSYGGRRNGILNNGFKSFKGVMDNRLASLCPDAINYGLEKRGLPVKKLKDHSGIVISQQTINILRYWLA
jgi:hypothetical protein